MSIGKIYKPGTVNPVTALVRWVRHGCIAAVLPEAARPLHHAAVAPGTALPDPVTGYYPHYIWFMLLHLARFFCSAIYYAYPHAV